VCNGLRLASFGERARFLRLRDSLEMQLELARIVLLGDAHVVSALLPECAEQTLAAAVGRVLEERDRDHLDVAGARHGAQLRGKRRFVARWKQRREKNQIGYTALENGERRLARLDEDKVDARQR